MATFNCLTFGRAKYRCSLGNCSLVRRGIRGQKRTQNPCQKHQPGLLPKFTPEGRLRLAVSFFTGTFHRRRSRIKSPLILTPEDGEEPLREREDDCGVACDPQRGASGGLADIENVSGDINADGKSLNKCVSGTRAGAAVIGTSTTVDL